MPAPRSSLSRRGSLASLSSSSSMGAPSFVRVRSSLLATTVKKKIAFSELCSDENFKNAVQGNFHRTSLTIDRIYEGTKKLNTFQAGIITNIVLNRPRNLAKFSEICGDPEALKQWIRQILQWAIINQFDGNALQPHLKTILTPDPLADSPAATKLRLITQEEQKSFTSTHRALCAALIIEHAPFNGPQSDDDAIVNQAKKNEHMLAMQVVLQVAREWADAKDDEELVQHLRQGIIAASKDSIDDYFAKAWATTQEIEKARPELSRDPKVLATLPPPPIYIRTPKASKSWIQKNPRAFIALLALSFVFLAGLALTLFSPDGQLFGMQALWWSIGAMAISMQAITAIGTNFLPKLPRKQLAVLGGVLFGIGCLLTMAPLPGIAQLIGLMLCSFGSAMLNATARTAIKDTHGKKWLVPGVLSFIGTLACWLIPSLGIIPWITKMLDLAAPTTEAATYLISDAITIISINVIGLLVNGLSTLTAWVCGGTVRVTPATISPATTSTASPDNLFITNRQPNPAAMDSPSPLLGKGPTNLANLSIQTTTIESLIESANCLKQTLGQPISEPDQKAITATIVALVTDLNTFNADKTISLGLTSILSAGFRNQPLLQEAFEAVYRNIPHDTATRHAFIRFQAALKNLNPQPVTVPTSTTLTSGVSLA